MNTTIFDQFRRAYLEYINEYNKYKDLLQFSQLIEDTGYKQELTETATKKLSQMGESSGLLAKILIARMHDTFIVDEERSAYLLSIKTFISRELNKWSYREPEEIKYKWQEIDKSGRVYRQWMPDYLYDIYFELPEIENRVKEVTPQTFSELFKRVSDFNAIKNILVDGGLINASGVWRDRKNGKKGYLIAILKYLQEMGYYNHDVANKTYKDVCENYFQLKIGIDTIKQTRPEKWLTEKEISLFPPPSVNS